MLGREAPTATSKLHILTRRVPQPSTFPSLPQDFCNDGNAPRGPKETTWGSPLILKKATLRTRESILLMVSVMTRRWSSDLPSSSFCTELAISPLPSVRFGINGYQEVSQECEGRMSMKEADFGEKENQS